MPTMMIPEIHWGVYLALFTKDGCYRLDYVGSRTAVDRGIFSQMLHTDIPAPATTGTVSNKGHPDI